MVDYHKVISMVDTSKFPIKITLSIEEHEGKPVLSAAIPDTRNVDDTTQVVSVRCRSYLKETESIFVAIKHVFNTIQKLFLHELAECFEVSSVRVFNPHDTGNHRWTVRRLGPKEKE